MPKFSRTYPLGVSIPTSIPCPEEVLRPTREGRTLVVETSRPGSIARLRVLGFHAYNKDTPSTEEVPEVVPEVPEVPEVAPVVEEKPKKVRKKTPPKE